jgi:fructosamine-3-kinase
MNNTFDWQDITTHIEQAIGQPFCLINSTPVSGGCINTAYILQSKDSSYFIKLNQAHYLSMFKAEFAGLKELHATQTIKVPQPIAYGTSSCHAFLILDYIPFISTTQQSDWQLGQQLAALHKIQQPFFGWSIDNTIGANTQVNLPSKNWLSFWRDHRLNFQLSLAITHGYGGKLIQSGEKLSESLSHFFNDYHPHPSLLHGDLWSGNAAVTTDGAPVIYDPACYYGDREADIAMTELFGRFGEQFYAGYQEIYPIDSGYSVRQHLYNLYHILNHLNLFGESYQHQAQAMIDLLLSEIR